MSTLTTPARAAIESIEVGENSRELDAEHVKALADSIALRGLIVPLLVSPDGERFKLIAGHHRYAACKSLGLADVEITLREQEGTSADSAAENVVRKALNPLEEARAVKQMLDEGYTLDGAATVLGWNRKLVSARAKILELPEIAQRLLANGTLPVSSVAMLASIAAVSPELCSAALQCVADGEIDGEQFASSPGWAIGYALRNGAKGVFAAHLSSLSAGEVQALRLPKKTLAAYAKAEELHKQLDSYAYGPPQVHFSEQEIDQARAAGVLIEFEHGTPIITDRELLRELARQAIERTCSELSARAQAKREQRPSTRGAGGAQSPRQALDSEHRAKMRELTARAHATNLDLGAALLTQLANVDPQDLDVARFFVYGLLGPERSPMGGAEGPTAVIAANGIRLVIDEHRATTTPTLKSGKPGVTKVSYGESEHATRWLWRFIEGARSAGELYGRALVVFAAQAYAHDLVLPASKRRGPALPRSRKETARKAFERITKKTLPATHLALARALEREARRYAAACEALEATPGSKPAATAEEDAH